MTRRTHLVLVPGFGGFDALGQIFYYAGVSFAAEEWRKAAGRTNAPLSLHYLDGLPTAGVRSRAMALRAFLEELSLRKVVQDDDRVTLLGHSTGGLDIRQLLVDIGVVDLGPRCRDDIGPKMVEDVELSKRIERLVFLSVPQRGTNVADFIGKFRTLVRSALNATGLALKTTHTIPLVERLDHLVHSSQSAKDMQLQLLTALRDVAAEIRPPADPKSAADRYGAAVARAAYGELVGWLDNVETDFFAIDDLSFNQPANALPTPGRYSDHEREQERNGWTAHKPAIRTLSFATVGRRPYDKDPDTASQLVSELAHVTKAIARGDDVANTDLVYRFVYAATAAGPFQVVGDTTVDDRAGQPVQAWENDGIVNTASMLWPDGQKTRLVHADHGDIIGHYKLTGEKKASETVTGRQYHSYDIFASNSGFGDDEFKRVWFEIFDFATAD